MLLTATRSLLIISVPTPSPSPQVSNNALILGGAVDAGILNMDDVLRMGAAGVTRPEYWKCGPCLPCFITISHRW